MLIIVNCDSDDVELLRLTNAAATLGTGALLKGSVVISRTSCGASPGTSASSRERRRATSEKSLGVRTVRLAVERDGAAASQRLGQLPGQ